jgi:hypothetical protein
VGQDQENVIMMASNDYLVENVLHISNNGVFEPLNYEFDITTVTANVFLDYDNDGRFGPNHSGIKTHEL